MCWTIFCPAKIVFLFKGKNWEFEKKAALLANLQQASTFLSKGTVGFEQWDSKDSRDSSVWRRLNSPNPPHSFPKLCFGLGKGVLWPSFLGKIRGVLDIASICV